MPGKGRGEGTRLTCGCRLTEDGEARACSGDERVRAQGMANSYTIAFLALYAGLIMRGFYL